MKRLNQGIGLLELMMVIAITAVAVIVSVNYFSSVRSAEKVNQAVVQVAQIYQGALSYYKTERYNPQTTSQDITDALVSGAYVPPADIASPWGGVLNAKGQCTSNCHKIFINFIKNPITISIDMLAPMPVKACIATATRIVAEYSNPNNIPNNTTNIAKYCQYSTSQGLTFTFAIEQ